MSHGHILIVEDDLRLAEAMRVTLKKEGFEVSIEQRGDLAVTRIKELRPDLVILDWVLPGLEGPEVCRRVRSTYHGHILMLTGRESEADQILGLDVGADDYLIKPVYAQVLVARVKAHLRRAQQTEGLDIRVDELYINASEREVRVGDTKLKLTTSEFDLLFYLASHAGKTISRQELYLSLRGIDYDGIDRSVDLRISKLRSHLKNAGFEKDLIKTVHGKGYHFAITPSASSDGAD